MKRRTRLRTIAAVALTLGLGACASGTPERPTTPEATASTAPVTTTEPAAITEPADAPVFTTPEPATNARPVTRGARPTGAGDGVAFTAEATAALEALEGVQMVDVMGEQARCGDEYLPSNIVWVFTAPGVTANQVQTIWEAAAELSTSPSAAQATTLILTVDSVSTAYFQCVIPDPDPEVSGWIALWSGGDWVGQLNTTLLEIGPISGAPEDTRSVMMGTLGATPEGANPSDVFATAWDANAGFAEVLGWDWGTVTLGDAGFKRALLPARAGTTAPDGLEEFWTTWSEFVDAATPLADYLALEPNPSGTVEINVSLKSGADALPADLQDQLDGAVAQLDEMGFGPVTPEISVSPF